MRVPWVRKALYNPEQILNNPSALISLNSGIYHDTFLRLREFSLIELIALIQY